MNFITEYTLIGLLFLAMALFVVFAAKSSKKGSIENDEPRQSDFKYKQISELMSPAELSFYHVLVSVIGSKAVIFSKVRVADVLKPDVSGDRSLWQKSFNAISSKHFDYVLCDPQTSKVIAAIELNDKSHKQKARQERDAFLEKACISADLKLYQFDAKRAYKIEEVAKVVYQAFTTREVSALKTDLDKAS
ncbi:DUF2726 domain-containing protein [Pseudoalteromonas sp. XMcav11-Q]|uniref:DUF2726 domain-containing protein n=1 Tax=Pseudoalteromonas sp. XMcav11-Q TaxID=3136665 RepID=UPI0032C44511